MGSLLSKLKIWPENFREPDNTEDEILREPDNIQDELDSVEVKLGGLVSRAVNL